MTLAEHIERIPVPVWTPWGELTTPPTANDNTPIPFARPLMIGLTGARNVGKSTVAALLESEYGFERVHTFESGKKAAVTWFDAIGGDGYEMVYGALKDVPSSFLPGNVSPRYFLEKFGEFMGVQLGVNWTLGIEIGLARSRAPNAPIVVESVVYETPWFRAQGGLVVRVDRPGHVGPAGIESDAVQARIVADYTLSATDVETLQCEARRMVQQMMGGW